MSFQGNFKDEDLAKLWRKIDWHLYEQTLRDLQRKIAEAAIRRDNHAVESVQKELVRSPEAKALAVKHVCESASQPGVDGVKWRTDEEKMRAAFALTSKDYTAQPMRMVIIQPKNSDKKRTVQISTAYDRAMQALYAYSLDPVSEATIDGRKSFAFRKGRSQSDVHAFIMTAFEGANPPRFLVKADIKACYASISHDWLLRNIPMDGKVLYQFLKAGHVFNGELFPSDEYGITLGSSLSPILANCVLNGLQKAIFDGLHGVNYGEIDYADGNLIRFADDILVSARTPASAEKILETIKSFAAVRGLTLSEEKTKIIKIEDGFDFLSRHYEYKDGFFRAEPSESAISKMDQNLRELIVPYRGGQKFLIEKLNKKLIGWANYHKITEAKPAFKYIDNLVKSLLLELCEKLNPRLPRSKIISKYFFKEANGDHVYALEKKPDVRLVRISETILVTHKPIATGKNPYIDCEYFEARTEAHDIAAVVGKYKIIWTRQAGKCHYCGNPILTDERKTLVLLDPASPETSKNQAYVHACCALGTATFIDSEFAIETDFELHELLEKLKDGKPKYGKSKHKFDPLTEYFSNKTESVFTLTFAEIGEILGEPLCESARKFLDYWSRRGELKISYAWHSNGYKIQNLDMKKQRVVFEKVKEQGERLKIPEVFLKDRIPINAKAELENFFEYVRKKYGI